MIALDRPQAADLECRRKENPMLHLYGLALIELYFLPALVAMARSHRAKLAIGLGWTVVGWLAALIWACNSNVKTAAAV